MSSQAILYPPPPPTTNLIDGKHRLRLMRSTKKLGAVLGTVAHISETDPKLIPEMLPIGVQHKTTPSTSSGLSSTSSTKSLRRQGSFFSTPSSTPELSHRSASPMSSVSSLSLTDVRSTEAPPPAHSSGRKAKRPTQLPRPLVLRLNAAPKPLQTATTIPYSFPATPSTARTVVPSTPYTPDTPTTPVSPTPSQTHRRRMAKLTRTLGERIPPQLVTFATKKRSIPSLKSALKMPETAASGVNRTPDRAGRRRSMSVDFGAGSNQHASSYPPRRSSRVWRMENGSWTGEWNRRDIQEVQKQLRNLKAR